MSSAAVCAACRRSIDAAAKLCPYCGANPVTGERIDTQAIRESRQDLVPLAHPQEGVDALRRALPGSTPIPGVVARPAAAEARSP